MGIGAEGEGAGEGAGEGTRAGAGVGVVETGRPTGMMVEEESGEK